jgi:cell pole-organizing protein PopZ
MEEILASIRRILNDDDVPAEATDAADRAPDDDVLVLDESMLVTAPEADVPAAVPEPEAAHFAAPPPDAEPSGHLPEQAPDQMMVAVTPPSLPAPREQPASTPNLLAPETEAAAASSVGSLVRTLAAGRATQVYSGGPTLEDMVRAELRPLLKEWLDVNLPPMVERLVRAEIERVVGREVP